MTNQGKPVRRTAAVLLAFGLIASVQVALAAADPIVIHVAPTGDDAGDGSRAKPVASLIGARDAVRRLRTDGKAGPVRVVVADGTYRFAEPLVLRPEDGGTAEAPVRYEAAPGAKPVFSGGRKITGFRAGENGLWVADVPGVAAGQWYFEQLWAGGRRAQRAMEPDTNWEEIAKLPGIPGKRQRARDPDIDPLFFENVVETNLGGGRFRQTSTVSQEVISLLAPLSPAQRADVQLSVSHNWCNSRRFISAIDAGNRTIITEGLQALRSYTQWKDTGGGSKGYFHLENFLFALDEPGEWFLAREGKLYYKPRPGEDPASMEFVAPVTSRFLLIQGDPAGGRFVEHVQFKGLAFRHSQWLTPAGGFGPGQAAATLNEAAVMLDGARNVLFQDCEIAHVGAHGLWFRKGCSQARVERCLIRDLGAGGVRIGEISIQSNVAERTHHITLDNNIIQNGGRIIPEGVGVWIGHSYDNAVTHNDIGDFYYSGVSVGWTWGFGNSIAHRNTISYNRLHHLGQCRMSDMAGVYSLGISDGTVISHNVIHDVYCWGYDGDGVYTDEGSSNILIENNLVYNVSDGGFKQHYGRYNIVRNNILAFSKHVQVPGPNQTRAGDHLSFTYEGNIVYFDQGVLFGRSAGGWEADAQVDLKNNIYWRAGGQSFNFAGRSWDQWRAMGRDEGSVIADPKFVNAANRDFRFASNETIQKTGFVPFDYSQAGVYGDPEWEAMSPLAVNPGPERRPASRPEGISFKAIRSGPATAKPNVVLIMTDDQGWGETGYNGHPHLKTPNIDALAANGLRMDRFYAAHPNCSPTRASVMTGRHPNRMGVVGPGAPTRAQELTLAQVLQSSGYATGHFGKWHLNGKNCWVNRVPTDRKTMPGCATLAGDPLSPGKLGFDEWVSADNFFDLDPVLGRNGVPEKFYGEGSDVTTDEALKFIRRQAGAGKFFFAVVWYGSPHGPMEALPADMAPYASLPKNLQLRFGEITAVDRNVGKLRETLRELKVADNTLVWFCSDNGAEAGPMSTGYLRGQKSTMWEGGLRVPGIVEWPARITQPRVSKMPTSTLDIYPTVLSAAGVIPRNQIYPLDGIDLLPHFDGEMTARNKAIPFWMNQGEQQSALLDWPFKLHTNATEGGKKWPVLLFNVEDDPKETTDLAAQQSGRVEKMTEALTAWKASVRKSLAGDDYEAASTAP